MSGGEIKKDGTPREIFKDVEGMQALSLDVPQAALLAHELIKFASAPIRPARKADEHAALYNTGLYRPDLYRPGAYGGVYADHGLYFRVPLKALFKGLKTIYILLAFTFLMNLFFSNSQSDHVLLKWGFIVISREGLIRAAFMAVRLILLVTGASIMTLTTSPIALTDGMERLMSPLAKIGFPAHETAMMMSIALRFIPTLMEEADRIMKAQSARGAGFSGGGLIKKPKPLYL